jgi:hypothetical protein
MNQCLVIVQSFIESLLPVYKLSKAYRFALKTLFIQLKITQVTAAKSPNIILGLNNIAKTIGLIGGLQHYLLFCNCNLPLWLSTYPFIYFIKATQDHNIMSHSS